MLVLDFETHSRCDLTQAGTYEYVTDPSTDIICMAARDLASGTKWLWYPESAIPEALKTALHFADYVVAHNAEFDKGIYECVAALEYDFPEIESKRWYCSSAQCRVNALPAGLDEAAFALGLTKRKHSSGKHLIKQLSIPNEKGYFNYDPTLIAEMGAYCAQDVEVTCEVLKNTRLMTIEEHKDWLVNTEINERGIKIDRPLAEAALLYAADEQAEIAAELTKLTGGEITKHTQHIRAKNYLLHYAAESGVSRIDELMTVYKKGVKKYSLDKSVRHNILEMADNGELDIDDTIYDVLCCIDDGNKSSVSKFKRMCAMASGEESRVRGAFVFAGASQTLRYASRGLQLHNMRRDCWNTEDAEILRSMMVKGQSFSRNSDWSVMETLSKLLRPALIPDDGKAFVVGDWSAIEGRAMPWLADSRSAEKKLDRFRESDKEADPIASGKDVYTATAADMGMEDRQLGKVAELSLQFGGGIGAFQSMAKNYRIMIPDYQAQSVVDNWRASNPWAAQFWSQLDTAARNAIMYPNTWYDAGRVSYIFLPDLIEGTLMCKLPGDNLIQYPKARLEEIEGKFGPKSSITCMKASYKPSADNKDWPRAVLWHGTLAENITQAFSAVLLRDALKVTRDVVAHVHDEIVMEVLISEIESAISDLKYTMENPLAYAEGLPLKADPKSFMRYGK